jgi:uncharacterized protein (TIGR03435 family)
MNLRIFTPLLLWAIAGSRAQQRPELPSFEVASIKPADASSRFGFTGGPGTDSPGQLRFSNYPLNGIVRRAFDKTQPWEIENLDAVPNDRYEISAKIPPGVTREQFYLMIQNLLAERFGMVAHKAMREMAVYEFVATKDGPRVTPVEKPPASDSGAPPPNRLNIGALPKDKDGWPILPADAVGMFTASVRPYGRYMFRAQPMSVMWEFLRMAFDRPLVDRTGLTGLYNFDLTVKQGSSGDTPAERSANQMLMLAAGLESSLGLTKVSAKRPVEVIVIERINKKPTEN